MERIKLAIEQAKKSAEQGRHEGADRGDKAPGRRSAGGSSTTHQAGSFGEVEDGPSNRMRVAPAWGLLIGLAVLATYWFVTRSDPGPMAADAATPASAAPSPASQVATLPAEVAAVPAVPAPASPTELPAEKLVEQVEVAVETWRSAWSARDMVAYFGVYSDSFVPADGTTHQAWKTSRYRNIGGRDAIEVTIRNLNIESLDQARARVSFLQDYASGNYREMNRPKTLDLSRTEDGHWRIIAEWQDKEGQQR